MTKPFTKPSLPGPGDIYQAVLSNGICVLVRSNFNSPSISMGGYLPAGAIFESDKKLGLAGFVASSLMRGTQTRSFDSIYNELESAGASLGFDSGVHNTSFGGRSLVEDLPLLLKFYLRGIHTPDRVTGFRKRSSPLRARICRNFIASILDRGAWSLPL